MQKKNKKNKSTTKIDKNTTKNKKNTKNEKITKKRTKRTRRTPGEGQEETGEKRKQHSCTLQEESQMKPHQESTRRKLHKPR